MVNELSLRIWTSVQELLLSLHRDEEGQGAAEYLVMTAAVVAVVAGVIFTAYTTGLTSAVGSLATKITDAIDGASS